MNMNNINPLTELEHRYKSLVDIFDVAPDVKAFHKTRQDDGSPHIELNRNRFDYVITERGQEWDRQRGLSADDILYLLLKTVTGRVASHYELKNRVPGIDGRSVWFPLQENLMSGLRPEWGLKLREEHRLILLRSPFKNA